MMDTISILQLPVIGYADKLKALKPEIQTRTRTVLDMDCTEETRAEIKKLRAELTKEFNEYETARKAVKAATSLTRYTRNAFRTYSKMRTNG